MIMYNEFYYIMIHDVVDTKNTIKIPYSKHCVPSSGLINNKSIVDITKYVLSDMPDEIKISTISISGNLKCVLHLENIYKYTMIAPNFILSLKFNGNIIGAVFKKKRNKKDCAAPLGHFENQLTLIVNVNDQKKINVKLFQNGAFQMTGCKSVYDVNIVLAKIINLLETKISIYDENSGHMIDKPYITNYDNIPITVTHFQIDMILANADVHYAINREILDRILTVNKIKHRYESDNHAAVNIKLLTAVDNTIIDKKIKKRKPVTIFVFQSGKIIITGAKNKNDVVTAYEYISNILEANKNDLMKKDIGNILDENDLQNILEEYENNLIKKPTAVEIEEDHIIV